MGGKLKFFARFPRLSIIGILVLIFVTDANALCFPEGENNESKNEFILSAVKSLASVKEADNILVGTVISEKGQSLTSGITEYLVTLKSANIELECAKSHVERFKNSSNKLIKESSFGIVNSIDALIKIHKDAQDDLKQILNDKPKLPDGDRAERDANARMATKAAWEQLGLSIALATHVVPDEKDQKYSSVSEATVKESVDLLKKSFPKKSLSDPKRWVDASAEAFQKVLTFKWKYKK